MKKIIFFNAILLFIYQCSSLSINTKKLDQQQFFTDHEYKEVGPGQQQTHYRVYHLTKDFFPFACDIGVEPKDCRQLDIRILNPLNKNKLPYIHLRNADGQYYHQAFEAADEVDFDEKSNQLVLARKGKTLLRLQLHADKSFSVLIDAEINQTLAASLIENKQQFRYNVLQLLNQLKGRFGKTDFFVRTTGPLKSFSVFPEEIVPKLKVDEYTIPAKEIIRVIQVKTIEKKIRSDKPAKKIFYAEIETIDKKKGWVQLENIQPVKTARIIDENVNLYKDASIKSQVLGSIAAKTPVWVEKVSEFPERIGVADEYWYLILEPKSKRSAWVHSSKLDVDIDDLAGLFK